MSRALLVLAIAILLGTIRHVAGQAQHTEDGAACKNQAALESLVQVFESGLEIEPAITKINKLFRSADGGWACAMVTLICAKVEPVGSIRGTEGFYVLLREEVVGIYNAATGTTKTDGPQVLYMSRYFRDRDVRGRKGV